MKVAKSLSDGDWHGLRVLLSTTREGADVTDSKMLVYSNAVEGQEDAFNDWYDTKHMSDVLAVPGVVAGQRFEVVPAAVPGRAASDPPTHRYLAVYELDEDAESVFRAFRERAASGEIPLSPSLDLTTLSVSIWRAHGERRVAD